MFEFFWWEGKTKLHRLICLSLTHETKFGLLEMEQERNYITSWSTRGSILTGPSSSQARKLPSSLAHFLSQIL